MPAARLSEDQLQRLFDARLLESAQDVEAANNLLREFSRSFDVTASESRLGVAIDVNHRIEMNEGVRPIRQRSYRYSQSERKVIGDQVTEMLRQGVIEASNSPWASPVVLVKKKDGSWRFCIDFRRVNAVTKKDVYPLPRIDDALDCLHGATWFSSLDLKSGYWQVPMQPDDREKTAFVTPDGLYQFRVMPFGLCNAPATFERMMDGVLRGLKWQICLCYLDDVLVFSTDFCTHLQRVRIVLWAIEKAGLLLNAKKCKFFAREVKVLGHVVNAAGIRPDPDKLNAVRIFPTPENTKQLQSFLGLCSYFRRFVPNFAHRAQALFALLHRNQEYRWEEAQQDAFADLKQCLTSEPLLGHFNPDAPTEIHTDASSFGIGAVLVQSFDGSDRPIAYASRTLTSSERNYSTTERECLAIIWAVGKFRPYLYGRHFSVITDHHALCWLTRSHRASRTLELTPPRIRSHD
jgi:hypothetical protein